MPYGDGLDVFATTEWTVPEKVTVRQYNRDVWINKATLHAGDVVRMNTWSAFPDSVILGFNSQGDAKVSRPYAYVSGVGTTGPMVLLGAETYVIPAKHIRDHYTVIENDGSRRT